MSDEFMDVLFGPVIEDRPCGDCVACCIAPLIDTPEFKKAEGVVCPNCTGAGCAVYDTRPQVCRTFNCAWKRIPSLPLETRPDKLGVMFTLERNLPPRNVFEHLFYVAVAVDDQRALETPLARDVLRMLSEGVLPVWVFWKGIKTLAHPDPDLADAILNPAPQRDRDLVRKGREWLKRYAPFARLGGGEHTKLPDGL
jgi:hypothetical protein